MKLLALATLLGAANATPFSQVVSEAPIELTLPIEAYVAPSEAQVYELRPQEWLDFAITSLLPQGSEIKKDDVLISFETDDIDATISEIKADLPRKKLEISYLTQELTDLEVGIPLEIERLKRLAARHREDYEFAEKHGAELRREQASQNVLRAQRALELARAALDQQIKKDSPSEPSEDHDAQTPESQTIKHLRAELAAAQSTLNILKSETERELSVIFPRQLEDLKLAAQEAELALKQAQTRSPQKLAWQKAELEKLKRILKQQEELLARLEADRRLFSLAAPGAGALYHGALEAGKWITPSQQATFTIGEFVPINKPLLTFIPIDSDLILEAHLSAEQRLRLNEKMSGKAIVPSHEKREFPIILQSLEPEPDLSGHYLARFSIDLPKNIKVGTKVACELLLYRNEKALAIPRHFLKKTPDGKDAVLVKLADGKSELRPVSLGVEANGRVEILKGLEIGQVVVKE